MNEEWKPIPNFEGLYEASSFGRIRSVPGKVTSNARYKKRVWKSRIMKTVIIANAKRQDERVTLWKDGKPYKYLVSRLVAMAWLGEPDDIMTVNHINGDYSDNRPLNLEWLSLEDNIKHGFRTGLYASIQNSVSLQAKGERPYIFTSMAQASRWLGHGAKYISDRLKKGYSTANSIDGTVYTIEVRYE